MKSYYVGLPKSIRVGASTVAIELKAELDGGRDWGQYEAETHTIRLSVNQPSVGAAIDVLLHEILHAIWNLARLRVNDDEERIVGTIASWQCQVLADNPRLMTWLSKSLAQ